MQYFELSGSKDLEALDQLFYTPRLNTDESVHELEIKNVKKREIIKIEELTENDGKSYKEGYLVSGATKEIQYDHLKVYKVEFMVENYDDAIAILQSGQYEWNFYLVWDEEKQEWLIDDFGWL